MKKFKIVNNVKNKIPRARRNRQAFIRKLPKNAAILDVGCGNNSAVKIKSYRPDIHYTGIDVGDYNNTKEAIRLMDAYIISEPTVFADKIKGLGARFDAVVSSHNLEHCNRPIATLKAMCDILKDGGLCISRFHQKTVRVSRTGKAP